jgi:transcriptional regulator with XRE-family HTH domain
MTDETIQQAARSLDRATNEKIGKIIKDKRKAKKLYQKDIAEALGYSSTQFIHLIESGDSRAPYEVLGKLCKILSIKQGDIVDIILDGFTKKFKAEFLAGFNNAKVFTKKSVAAEDLL